MDPHRAAKASEPPKCCEEKRPQVRGEPVISGVLAAVIAELARVGYRALRVEDVAARAQVNKTTIYRRWPTKSELVRAALTAKSIDVFNFPTAGSLRHDLLAMGRCFMEAAAQPEGRSVIRMLVAEGGDPEVAELKARMREHHGVAHKAMLAAAVKRGELAEGVDHQVIVETFAAAMFHRMMVMNEPVNDAYLKSLVDLMLLGALEASARKPKRARKPARRDA